MGGGGRIGDWEGVLCMYLAVSNDDIAWQGQTSGDTYGGHKQVGGTRLQTAEGSGVGASGLRISGFSQHGLGANIHFSNFTICRHLVPPIGVPALWGW